MSSDTQISNIGNESIVAIDPSVSLDVTENHFSKPEEFSNAVFDVSELKSAVERCKEMILETPEYSEKRKNLIKRLVSLRLQLQHVNDRSEDDDPNVQRVLGHHMEKKQPEIPSVQRYCEKCSGHIWGMIHTWYRCRDCGLNCHGKCVSDIARVCAHVKVEENPMYIMSICPEVGLATQGYKCFECHASIVPKAGSSSMRQCDYNGNYYCSNCHWNSLAVIPARVLRNWDFEPRQVCRASKQFLRLMKRRAVIAVRDINPQLFSFVEELSVAQKLRADILVMKQYFVSCKAALERRLLLQLADRQHFVDGPHVYSLQDLIDIQSGALLEYLERVHAMFAYHIRDECQVCRGKGFICEACEREGILFPFDTSATVCGECGTVLHTECFFGKGRQCPKCARLRQKTPAS